MMEQFLIWEVKFFNLGEGIYLVYVIEALKFVGYYTLSCFGLCILPVYFWHKAKKSEYGGILCVSVALGEVYAIVKEIDGIWNFIATALIGAIVAFIALLGVFLVVSMAINEGEKEFSIDKQYYCKLKDKPIDELTSHEVKRLKYFETHKEFYSGDFKPDRISINP